MKTLWTGINTSTSLYSIRLEIETDSYYEYKKIQKACRDIMDNQYDRETAAQDEATYEEI